MKFFLLILGVIAIALGALVFNVAQGAPHEIEALILFLIGAVLMSGYSITNAIEKGRSA